MKHLVRTLFLAGVLMALLCVTAMAADTPQEDGIFGEKQEGTNPVTISAKEKDNLTVTVSNPQAGAQYLVLALSDTKTPTASNIVYIDQTGTDASGNVSFKVYPSKLANKITYHVYVTSDSDSRYNKGLTEVASFKYYASYRLGYVAGGDFITATDALYALQIAVGIGEWEDTQILAANVDGDEMVTASDAMYILRVAVGLDTL